AERQPMQRVEGEAARSTLVASADLRRMELGRILRVPMMGALTATMNFDGSTSKDGIRGRVNGSAQELAFNDAQYSNIDIDGMVINKSFSGSITGHDAPLRFDLDGLADLNGANPIFDLTLDVAEADLHAMNINERDSLSLLSFRSELYAVGRTLDDLNGTLSIDNGHYRYNADTLASGPIRLAARSAAQRSLTLTSDFADATFTGPTSYKTLVGYLQSAMTKYLPGLSFKTDYKDSGEDAYSALSVKVKEIDPLLNAISEGLQLSRGSQLSFVMNPATDHLALRAESDYIERGKLLITNLNLNLTNQSDSLVMYLNSEDLYSGALHLPRLTVMGGAKHDRVSLSAGFNDTTDSLSGVVALRAQLHRVGAQGMPRLDVNLLPTTIYTPERDWRVTSDSISLDTARISIRDFRIESDRQSLRLDGVASRHREDSLTMYLREFELSPFMLFAERMGYNVKGRANGAASIKAALDRGEITADVKIDSMTVNETGVAPLHIVSRWDLEQQRIQVEMNNARTGGNVVQGYYDPTTKRYYADGNFQNLPLSMLDPVLRTVVSQTAGRADARLNIAGEGRAAKLNGEVKVADLSTMVDFTRARYSVESATVRVENNHFIANNVRVSDTEQNSGTFTMDLSLDHLSNIAYNMRVVPRNMIVLNTTAQDNDLFYGKVYGSGTATIQGDKSGTTLDITGTTQGNSQFFMPLSSKSDISSADFVVFEQPGVELDTTNYLQRKKMAFERRSRSSTTSSGSNMSINIELTATPTTEVQLVIDPTVGDIIRGRGNGTLNMRIVPSANVFDMYGDYTITEGSYLFTLQNIINKRFVINSGSTIQWTGDPLDARLDIDAVYKLRASLQPLLASTTLDNVTRAVPVECIINLTERLTSPTVTFDIKVPNADTEIQNAVSNLLNNQQSIATQFMYLLVSGSFYSDSSTSSSIGATASATTGFELLSNQLSNWLSSDDYNIILRYRPRSELTSDEIDFGFSKSLVDNRLLVEVEGNYLVDNRMAQSSNMSNFMGEAYITWLIDRAGALKLRGFTQTIDRFDENQGLQETGVGIYYKEDFDNWADLRRRIRDRFMGKRRRAALEAAQQAIEEAREREATQATEASQQQAVPSVQADSVKRDSTAQRPHQEQK
ncbi:MAG: translocation/assembly module TamB domain-containing protein, partial [Alistipes sp.]|nr:translocation/assembly module TamB domain-containing protein [Alistipes sp.]